MSSVESLYLVSMKSPFRFGRVVTGKSFINREEELNRLLSNFTGGINTILISPRRWGKSSLISKSREKIQRENPSIKFCQIDLFKIRDEKDFYGQLAQEVIKQSSSKLEDWLASAKEFFKAIVPRISVGSDPMNDFEIGFDFKNLNQDYKEILELPEKLALKRKLKFVICIDEFQNLANFKEPMVFQKRLRSVWQYHQETTYCLYGSHRGMLMALFEEKSNPFYKFGDLMILPKIHLDHWRRYITKSFHQTDKEITVELADEIVKSANSHPFYVQQLSHLVWQNTNQKVTLREVKKAKNDLIIQYEIVYQKEVDNLTNPQLNFLKALAKGEEKFNSAEVMKKYQLGASSNVVRLKGALDKKGIIDTFSSKLEFADPSFELWFRKNFV